MPSSDFQSPDVGLSHVALLVQDVDASIDFYRRYARMNVVHRRGHRGRSTVWLSDLSRPFVLVLMETDQVEGRLDGYAHLGVGCNSREEVDALCDDARSEGRLVFEPEEFGAPVGYTALLRDPDGHNLELSFGQHVGDTVDAAASNGEARVDGDDTTRETHDRRAPLYPALA